MLTPPICPQEERLLRALAQGGDLPLELRQHLSACTACAETAAVWEALHTLDNPSAGPHASLPSPQSIWWRAQLAERRALAEKSVASIAALQKIALAAALLLAVVASILWSPALAALCLPAAARIALFVFLVGAMAGLFALKLNSRAQRPL